MTNWTNYQASIRQHLDRDSLSDFLQWSTIQATMFVGNAPYVEFEYDCLLGSKQSVQWVKVIKETWVGNPTPFNDYTSGNLIHQAYHLKQWLDHTQQKLSEIHSIVEIGAGYGAMALLCRRLGFKGTYYVIDLPELIKIQRYYLAVLGLTEKMQWFTREMFSDLYVVQDDLFIASHSLSEMPVVEREKYLSQVTAKEYLFASSYEYERIDNQAWFQQQAGVIGRDWKFYPHKYQENAFYQIGVEL
jgi:O-methyltransferase